MSEKWDYVPDFQAAAGGRGLIAELSNETGFDYSHLTFDAALKVRDELLATSERLIDLGAEVVAWAVEWIADDITELLPDKLQGNGGGDG